MNNIAAAKAVSDIIRTCLGPRSMLKMLLDPMGGLVLTNDGNAILREIDMTQPAAKTMLEISRAQDEEVGDGTTSVIVLTGEMLTLGVPLLERNMHPTVIAGGYSSALDDALEVVDKLAFNINVDDRAQMTNIVASCIGTKFVDRWSDLVCNLAIDSVLTVTTLRSDGKKDIDIKRYAKVEKIPGGEMKDSEVLKGVMFNKDITHPKMRRRIQNPRILLLDCPLEYKKGESQTNVEMTKMEDFETLLRMEEEAIAKMCENIMKFSPDVVVTEKGVSDLAQHFLLKKNISVIRRLRKTDNNRIARACGAQVVSRVDEIQEGDIGTGAGLFEVRKLGDEYFTFITDCKDPKACTIILRGASKDVLNEVERNLLDAMNVARNVVYDPRLLPGGGAVEMEVAVALAEKSKSVDGVAQWPYRAVGTALEVIPRTLAQNCGADVVRVITQLRAKHAQGGNLTWGINGKTGEIADMKELGIWEPYLVKVQTMKTAVETSCMLFRIDDIVSGLKKRAPQQQQQPQAPQQFTEDDAPEQ